jgi:hypothetical protein
MSPAPLQTYRPSPSLVSPSPIWFPLLSRPRLGKRGGGSALGPGEMMWGAARKELGWSGARVPLVRNLSPAPPFCTSEWRGPAGRGWRGSELVPHSGLTRGPFRLWWRKGVLLVGEFSSSDSCLHPI